MSQKKTSLGLLKYDDHYLTFNKGAAIFREGDRGCEMFVVRAGTVELQVTGHPVETLERGDFLGEMALVDNEPRSATAICLTDCQVVPVNREKFQYLVKETPYVALEVMHRMAERLRRMNRATSILHRDAAPVRLS
jgi:CRP/FNR family transcriptional regulator, cyclic AMP receptor protein